MQENDIKHNGMLWHASSSQEVLSELQTSLNGLTDSEASERMKRYGANILLRKGSDSPWLLFWRQINNPIGWLLIASGSLAIGLQKITDAVVVFGAVVINAIIGFIQEYRAGQAIEALAAMMPEFATALRNGQSIAVSAESLVPGDLVTLQSGDKVPADLRLIRVKNLLVEEAALTGESLPVAKRIDPVAQDASLGDRIGMAYSGRLFYKELPQEWWSTPVEVQSLGVSMPCSTRPDRWRPLSLVNWPKSATLLPLPWWL